MLKTHIILGICLLPFGSFGTGEIPPSLLEALRAQSYTHQTPAPEALKEAKDQLVETLAMVASSYKKTKWLVIRRELGIRELDIECKKPEPDLSALSSGLLKLTRNIEKPADLSHPQWKKLRADLRTYLRMRRALEPNALELIEAAYEDLMSLATDEWREQDIRRSYRTLIEYGQKSDVLVELKSHLSHSNFYFGLNMPLFQTLKKKIENRPVEINEKMMGISTVGTGVMNGMARILPKPNEDQAEFSIVMSGTAHSKVTSTKVLRSGSVANVFSNVKSKVSARQSLLISKNLRLSLGQLQLNVEQNTRPQASQFCPRRGILRGRVRARVALRVANNKVCEADSIGAQKTKEKISQEVDEKSKELLKMVNGLIEDQVRKPIDRGDLFPVIHGKSTKSSVTFHGQLGTDNDLGFLGSPPQLAIPNSTALYASLHESAINNNRDMVAGESVAEYDFRRKVFGKFANVSEDSVVAGKSPSSIRLESEGRPYSIQFRGGKIVIRINLQSLEVDGTEYKGRFGLVTEYALRARRDPTSGVVIAFEGVRPEAVQVSLDGVVITKPSEHPNEGVRMLGSIADRFFLEAFELKEISTEELNDDFNLKMQGDYLLCDGGWLVVGFRVSEKN